MGFTIGMNRIEKEELQEIRDDRGGRYDGPVPPPGTYMANVDRMWFTESKRTGAPMILVSFKLDNDGVDSEYNGASALRNYMIPTDPSQRAYPVQVSTIDTLFLELSGGKFGFSEFQDAVIEGKNNADKDKKDKLGIPVSQIGSLKITGNQKVKVKTEVTQTPKGDDRMGIHYVMRNEKPAAKVDDELDLDDDFDGDDIGDLLED